MQRMNVLKEDIQILQNKNSSNSNSKAPAVVDIEVIRAENESLKLRLGSEEYKFLSACLLRIWKMEPKCSMIPSRIKN